MTSQLLLPYYSGDFDPIREFISSDIDQGYVPLVYNGDLNQYYELSKKLRLRKRGLSDKRHKLIDYNYLALFNAYKAYGSGYADAARRYRSDWIFSTRAVSAVELSEAAIPVLRYSRLTFGYFIIFATLTVVAIGICIRGYVFSSMVAGQISVFVLGLGILSGIAWLGRAEVERRNFRGF